MSTAGRIGLDRFKQSAYTGENRCLPCTGVNLVLAGTLSAAATVVALPLGVVVAVVSLLAIYFRGYLVPGTPTLTKRYFPDWLLQAFDKTSSQTLDTDLDIERQLLAVGAVEPAGDDVRLTDEFGAAWEAEIDRARGDLDRRVGDLLALDDPSVDTGTSVCYVLDSGKVVGQWPSTAALIADVAAVPLLRDRATNWDDLPQTERGRLLAGLRLFVETCPDCGGTLAFSEEEAESCCRFTDVVTYDCTACGARVMEVEQ